MNVENEGVSIIAVPAGWTFRAVLGGAFPLDRRMCGEFELRLAALDPPAPNETSDGRIERG